VLFTIVLGILVGAAGLTLVRQWLDGVLAEPAHEILSPAAFPRLAPPRRRAA
jgi:hypothetical protein